jgi:5-methylcytosine-specific restriction endonuclease McrA
MQVLSLNSAGQPLGLIDWFRAVTLLWRGSAVLIEGDENNRLSSPSWSTPRPLIIQLDHYVKLVDMHDTEVAKDVLFARDGWECQYCGRQINKTSGSIDHVKPRRFYRDQGLPVSEAHVWENVVSACKPCNGKKGGRLPHEAGMYPRKAPRKPTYVQTMWAARQYHPVQAQYVADYFRIDPSDLMAKKILPSHQ